MEYTPVRSEVTYVTTPIAVVVREECFTLFPLSFL